MANIATHTVVDIPSQSHYLTARKFLTVDVTVTSGAIFFCDASAASFTVTLPDAATYPERVLTFKLVSATNSVTIEGDNPQTIDGASDVTLSTQYDYLTVVSDGSNWFVIT